MRALTGDTRSFMRLPLAIGWLRSLLGATRAMLASILLIASATCFAQPNTLATKLAAGSPWRVSVPIRRFTPFTWRFRISVDGKLERRTSGEWREQNISAENTLLIEGRDGNVYTIGLDANGEVTVDRTNLPNGAQVSIESKK